MRVMSKHANKDEMIRVASYLKRVVLGNQLPRFFLARCDIVITAVEIRFTTGYRWTSEKMLITRRIFLQNLTTTIIATSIAPFYRTSPEFTGKLPPPCWLVSDNIIYLDKAFFILLSN